MPSLQPETFLFVAPGLLHRLGNVFLSIQGNAHLLRGAGDDRGCTAILEAAARGADALESCRFLLGEVETTLLPVARVIEPLAEVLRIPVRGTGHGLQVQPTVGVDGLVDASAVAIQTTEAVRRLACLVPEGQRGTITVAAEAEPPHTIVVAVGFAPDPGCLPFPLPAAALAEGGRIVLRFAAQRPPVRREA